MVNTVISTCTIASDHLQLNTTDPEAKTLYVASKGSLQASSRGLGTHMYIEAVGQRDRASRLGICSSCIHMAKVQLRRHCSETSYCQALPQL